MDLKFLKKPTFYLSLAIIILCICSVLLGLIILGMISTINCNVDTNVTDALVRGTCGGYCIFGIESNTWEASINEDYNLVCLCYNENDTLIKSKVMVKEMEDW